jgi:hypothetical protein
VSLTGCATMMGSSAPTEATPVACSVFEPIYWSGSDTDETIKQAKAHNAAWKSLCGKEPEL